MDDISSQEEAVAVLKRTMESANVCSLTFKSRYFQKLDLIVNQMNVTSYPICYFTVLLEAGKHQLSLLLLGSYTGKRWIVSS